MGLAPPLFSPGCVGSECESMLGKWWCNEAVVKWLLLQSLSGSSGNQQRAAAVKTSTVYVDSKGRNQK